MTTHSKQADCAAEQQNPSCASRGTTVTGQVALAAERVTVVLVQYGPVPTADVSNVLVFGTPRVISQRTHGLRAAASAGRNPRPDPTVIEDEDHIYRAEN